MTSDDVEVLAREPAYRGFFQILRYRLRHRLFGGGMSEPLTREVFHRGNSVGVLAYDPWRDTVVLVRQFRVGALEAGDAPWLVEVIAGAVEEGERAEEVARREAMEEAGCRLGPMEWICRYFVSPGGASERVDLFCARVDSAGAGGIHGLADEGEDIECLVVPADEALGWLAAGRVDNAPTLIGLQWLAGNRQRLREQWGSGAD